jgi:hypothetical protein
MTIIRTPVKGKVDRSEGSNVHGASEYFLQTGLKEIYVDLK